jgi:hypothetical protein
MSTRCQIGFYESKAQPINQWEALLYRHSDGYPGEANKPNSGVIPDILPLLKDFAKTRGLSDVESASAQILYHLIAETQRHRAEFRAGTKLPEYKNDYTGHGICKDFHGDIEFFYRIYPNALEVYEVPFHAQDGPPELWKLLQAIPLA